MNIFAPGGRVLIRDKEWLVRRVDNSNDGGLLLSCEGVTERKKTESFIAGEGLPPDTEICSLTSIGSQRN